MSKTVPGQMGSLLFTEWINHWNHCILTVCTVLPSTSTYHWVYQHWAAKLCEEQGAVPIHPCTWHTGGYHWRLSHHFQGQKHNSIPFILLLTEVLIFITSSYYCCTSLRRGGKKDVLQYWTLKAIKSSLLKREIRKLPASWRTRRPQKTVHAGWPSKQ